MIAGLELYDFVDLPSSIACRDSIRDSWYTFIELEIRSWECFQDRSEEYGTPQNKYDSWKNPTFIEY